MNDTWIEYDSDNNLYTGSVEPPEGVEVAVTDGKSILFMWLVYSGGPEWCWENPDDIDGILDLPLPFHPTHWMDEENTKKYRRDMKIEELVDENI